MIDIERAQEWVKDHAGPVFVGATGALLAISVAALASTITDDGSAEAEQQAEVYISDLQTSLDDAQTSLSSEHDQLLNDLGLDTERLAEDRQSLRTLVLALAGSSPSSRDVAGMQAHLTARFGLSEESQVLSSFLPEFMAATGSARGSGPTFTLNSLDVQVGGISDDGTYAYTALAQLDPVGSDDAEVQYLLVTYATTAEGSVSSLEVQRLSDESRDDLVAAHEDQTASEDSSTDDVPDSDASDGSDGSDAGR